MTDIDEILAGRKRREQERQMEQAIEERAEKAKVDKERSDAIGEAIGKIWKP